MNGKRLIVARSGGSNTSWKAERDYYVKHFLLFPCLCFPPPPFFFCTLYTLFVVWSRPACATNTCLLETQSLAFYFPASVPLLSPPSFLFSILFLVFIQSSVFFVLHVQPVKWNVFFVWLFFSLSDSFCEPVLSFHCSVCCVWTLKKKREEVGRAVVFIFLSKCDCCFLLLAL